MCRRVITLVTVVISACVALVGCSVPSSQAGSSGKPAAALEESPLTEVPEDASLDVAPFQIGSTVTSDMWGSFTYEDEGLEAVLATRISDVVRAEADEVESFRENYQDSDDVMNLYYFHIQTKKISGDALAGRYTDDRYIPIATDGTRLGRGPMGSYNGCGLSTTFTDAFDNFQETIEVCLVAVQREGDPVPAGIGYRVVLETGDSGLEPIRDHPETIYFVQ